LGYDRAGVDNRRGGRCIRGHEPIAKKRPFFNGLLGVPYISIYDGAIYDYVVFQGNYSAMLASYTYPFVSADVGISQTAIVPSGTESIEFEANELNSGSFVVTFDGDPINMVPLQRFPNYTLYGGDVSPWAGQDATLSITQLAPPTPSGLYSPSLLQLDDITFSPTQVTPEPSPFVLMSIGGLLFAIYRRFASKPR
jgi:hypothetical protein